jgi:ABC-type dipeptide/oligopeptide/nickel transport system, ATPase component
MKQRVMIAMALACKPKLLIADEPTTALDTTIQAQVLKLMSDLQKETGMSILLITHDMGIVNQIADDICIMYAGRISEKRFSR